MTSKTEEKEIPQIAEPEVRLEGALGNWVNALESFEVLVDGMSKNALKRAVKAAFAHPLEHEKVSLKDPEEHKFLAVFANRDADKLNASLAHMEIEGKKLQEQQTKEQDDE